MIARHFPKQLPKSDESVAPGLSGEASAFAMNLNAVNAAQVVFLDALKKNDASGIDETVQALDQAHEAFTFGAAGGKQLGIGRP